MRRTTIRRSLLLVLAAPFLLGSLGPRTNFYDRLLAAHNRERALLAIPPLEWDADLAVGAKAWADYLSRTRNFKHSPDDPGPNPEGENIWGGTPRHFLPEQMVGLWIAEKKHFQDGTFPHNSRTGRVEDVSHYTQVVWRRTTRVGCGISAAGPEEIMVCRYSQAGNVLGEQVF